MAIHLDQERSTAVNGAVWLIGFGVLFATGAWWPGILLLLGISSVVQGLVGGQGWYAFQGGLWAFGLWGAFRYNLGVLFVVLGISAVLGAFVRSPSTKVKPQFDATLE